MTKSTRQPTVSTPLVSARRWRPPRHRYFVRSGDAAVLIHIAARDTVPINTETEPRWGGARWSGARWSDRVWK